MFREDSEKYITFSVSIKKIKSINNYVKKITKRMSRKW